jgi:very-short-patch-repair endonuclease
MLRRRTTPAEQDLWQELRGQRLNGLRFRLQHPVGPYILDFACPERLLGIEIDGSVHIGNEEKDDARTALFEDFGWHIIRFPNDEVLSNLSTVLVSIEAAATSRPIAKGWNPGKNSHGDKSPSPNVGGGVGVGAISAKHPTTNEAK